MSSFISRSLVFNILLIEIFESLTLGMSFFTDVGFLSPFGEQEMHKFRLDNLVDIDDSLNY